MTTGKAEASVDGTVIASATEWEVVEGNVYFPPSSIKKELFTETQHHTSCPWKGEASYYTINVDGKSDAAYSAVATREIAADENAGKELKNAAWFYPQPKDAAKQIKDYVAFCRSLLWTPY
jgi:uncharacterized protein (DUF427 family)